jgi:hypothetical protein
MDPSEMLQAVLQAAVTKPTVVATTSRYYGIEVTSIETADGRTVVYLRRRIVPLPERFALLQEHVVKQIERLDHIAARYVGDPEQFWRICDANAAMRPEELTETEGRRLRITLPDGVPGMPHA